MNYKQSIIQVVREYNNKERVCGVVDCNLLILQIYEPEYFKALVGSYRTIKEGIKHAKKCTGYRSISELLNKSNKYVNIQEKNAMFGDIIIVKNKPCTALHLGDRIFGLLNKNNKEIFGTYKKSSNQNYIYFRRV